MASSLARDPDQTVRMRCPLVRAVTVKSVDSTLKEGSSGTQVRSLAVACRALVSAMNPDDADDPVARLKSAVCRCGENNAQRFVTNGQWTALDRASVK